MSNFKQKSDNNYRQKSSSGKSSDDPIKFGTQSNDQLPIQTGGLQHYILSSQPLKRTGSGKLIATVLSLLILLGGIMAGIMLTSRNQEIREKADVKECLESEYCINLDNPEDSGTFTVKGTIYNAFLTDRFGNTFKAGTVNECYEVNINVNVLDWERNNTNKSCERLTNIQIWTELK